MLKTEAARGSAGAILLMDSITLVAPEDAGAVVVTGSHGGVSSAEFALEVPLSLVVFNDAGVGKDEAGIAGLARLQQQGVGACTVSHTSARIGDARDAWEHGVVSHANAQALQRGVSPGDRLQGRLLRLMGA